ncbi:adenosylcobinamide-GDP ribazoletransferase [Peribacillus simplex]|uniref:adenosylcobinamide-GDP ribazoletransferase n=1 Tax=Peribacillus simplex TaxID=1478 RepID=UPI000BA6D7FC|nr:adenosylcobinamide-GDP ribazoletransferase [Peribacillus simplex]PAL13179.1 adenosylcobinamide-GDP ribazoletransferase [Peribacillus simplex]
MSGVIGFLINLQFFTVFPIKKQLPMEKKYIHRAIQTFPLVGLLLGLILGGVLYALVEWTPLSSLSIAFFLWFLTMALTGGLHLDGWIDASDAFFSYQDKERRLEIMKDSRTGAFGVISVIVLLAARFLFIYEIVERVNEWTYFLIIALPLLSKCVMGYLLIRMPLAKKEGLGAFFQSAVMKSSLPIYWLYLLGSLAFAWIIDFKLVPLFIMMCLAAAFFLVYMKRKIVSWFGGITGDVLGASVEGVELWLWLILWLLHYFAMG